MSRAEDSARRASLAAAREQAESREAQALIDGFLAEARARGIAPEPLRATLYDGLSALRRARLHSRVGEALMGLRRVCADVRFLGSYERHDGVAPTIRTGTSDGEFYDAAAWLARLRDGR